MSQATRSRTTSAEFISSRRSVLTNGLGIAAASLVGTTALSTSASAAASATVTSEEARLTEARRLITGLIATDREITAAENADDDPLVDQLEGRHKALARELRKLANTVYQSPPSSWEDIVLRAEIAGYPVVWDKERGDWRALLRAARRDPDAGSFALKELAAAILYVAHA